jgi:hypothetical protein
VFYRGASVPVVCFGTTSLPLENGFILTPTYPVTKSAPVGMLCGTGGDDSIMLEAIMLLLGLAACALILIAFWGLDVFRIRSRWH